MAATRTLDLDNNPLMRTLGFRRLIESNPDTDRIVIEFDAKQEQCHSGNIIQGGFVTGWIDTAMAQAAMLKTNYELVPLSLEIKIAFYRAANPGIVVAEGWVELLGRKTAFVEGLLRTPDGEIIAKGTSTVTLKAFKR
jgi:acyl-CoA thioesterase